MPQVEHLGASLRLNLGSMQVQRLAPIAFLALAAGARAQTAEQDITLAFAALAANSELRLVMNNGTLTSAPTWQADLFWKESVENGKVVERVELVEVDYPNPSDLTQKVIRNRVVGDGFTLFHYIPTTRQSAAVRYGEIYDPQPQAYRRQLLNFLAQTTSERSAYLVRWLAEMKREDGALYKSWMPGYTPVASEVPELTNPLLGEAGRQWRYQDASGAKYFNFHLAITVDQNLATVASSLRNYNQFANNQMVRRTMIEHSVSRQVGSQVRSNWWFMWAEPGAPPADYVPFQTLTNAQMSGWRTVPWLGLRRTEFSN